MNFGFETSRTVYSEQNKALLEFVLSTLSKIRDNLDF